MIKILDISAGPLFDLMCTEIMILSHSKNKAWKVININMKLITNKANLSFWASDYIILIIFTFLVDQRLFTYDNSIELNRDLTFMS